MKKNLNKISRKYLEQIENKREQTQQLEKSSSGSIHELMNLTEQRADNLIEQFAEIGENNESMYKIFKTGKKLAKTDSEKFFIGYMFGRMVEQNQHSYEMLKVGSKLFSAMRGSNE